MLWIIDDNIEFIPEKNKLASLSRPELSVLLTRPASRCLVLLLEAAHSVVLHQTFFEKVWPDEVVQVPTNTLYQNISIVRRGLRAVGETDKTILATVSRRGFQIESNVKVVRISAEEYHNTAQVEALYEPPATPDAPLAADTQRIVKSLAKPRRRVCVLRDNKWPALHMAVAFLLGVLVVYGATFVNANDSLFENYTLFETSNGCHFYSTEDEIDDNSPFQKDKATIINTGLDCQKYPWVYFPSSNAMPALTALICQKPYNDASDSGCVSLYFRGVARD
ncbi:winged helix-turn-helix domain-containing protein [Trabulsiella odontotermitis]|uniref:winged helix-turn-helix domain-containing protein n=1 Tax=Trabulsiella odontotermitis TaxID=379893 RepID=UPI0024B7CD90|nr:winged helix-turn-helix domain-containing protein [Trabulsiella odontotermitis]WHP33081.1 winged helix-turn-helix domain-containing protein [Trabulsiella odontotermitis]